MLREFCYIFLVFLGLSQIIGYTLKVSTVEHIGIWSLAAPLPLVFSGGNYEHFSTQVIIKVTTISGQAIEQKLSVGDFTKIDGPFMRRSPYAVVLAYAPELPNSMVNAVLEEAFCNAGPIASAMTEEAILAGEILITPLSDKRKRTWKALFECQAS